MSNKPIAYIAFGIEIKKDGTALSYPDEITDEFLEKIDKTIGLDYAFKGHCHGYMTIILCAANSIIKADDYNLKPFDIKDINNDRTMPWEHSIRQMLEQHKLDVVNPQWILWSYYG